MKDYNLLPEHCSPSEARLTSKPFLELLSVSKFTASTSMSSYWMSSNRQPAGVSTIATGRRYSSARADDAGASSRSLSFGWWDETSRRGARWLVPNSRFHLLLWIQEVAPAARAVLLHARAERLWTSHSAGGKGGGPFSHVQPRFGWFSAAEHMSCSVCDLRQEFVLL